MDRGRNRVESGSKEEAVYYANSRMEEMSAKRAEKKNSKKYGINSKSQKYEQEVNEKAKQIAKDTGVTERLAKAQARSQVAAKHRAEGKASKQKAFDSKHKVIAGARGFASKVGTAGAIFKESETAKFLKDMGQASIAAGVGTFVGASSYGVSGNAFNALALGTATYKGSQEYLKNSTGTLVDTSQKLCGGVLGAKNSAQVENEMKMTKAMAPILGDNQEFQRQIDELLKFVETALGKDSDEANDAKSTIRNTISKNLKENPGISMEELMSNVKGKLGDRESLKNATTKDGQSMEQFMASDRFNSGVTSVAQLQARKELYDTMEQGSSLGLSADALTRMTSRSFKENTGVSEGGYQTANEIAANISDGSATLSKEQIDQLAEERTEEGLGQIRKELQKEHEEITKKINNSAEGADISDLDEQDRRVQEAMRVFDERQREEIGKKMQEYEAQYADAIKRLEADATDQAQKKFDTEVAKMRKEVEEFKSKMEREFGKAHGVGIYTTDINRTLNSMKNSSELDSE